MRRLFWMGAALVYSTLVHGQVITATPRPEVIYIERREDQRLNFDVVLSNTSVETLTLDRVEIAVFDRRGRLELRKFIDTNGFSPAINILPNREIKPGHLVLIFNPFYSFDSAVELFKLNYELTFSEKDSDKEYKSSFVVSPTVYETKTDLILPVDGPIIVHDGHDFYAHHRRLDYLLPIAEHYGLRSNFMRYAYDLCMVNETGQLFKTDGKSNEDWYSFNAPVRAPGSGRVVAAFSGQSDNLLNGTNYFDPEKLVRDPMSFYGNYVVIDHQNGEYSVLGHLRQGSVVVKTGDRVKQGDEIARIGASGSANNPHLHYELRTGNGLNVEGLPSYFRNFERLVGSKTLAVSQGQIDSGDIVRNVSPRNDHRWKRRRCLSTKLSTNS